MNKFKKQCEMIIIVLNQMPDVYNLKSNFNILQKASEKYDSCNCYHINYLQAFEIQKSCNKASDDKNLISKYLSLGVNCQNWH